MLPPSRSLAVRAVEACGAYTLLRLARDGADAGVPGQFFMLRADPAPADAYLPRPISAAWADDDELAFLLDIRGPGTRALAAAGTVDVLGPLGRGFELAPGPALLVGGGIGLEHEELPRHARLGVVSPQAKERVCADGLDAPNREATRLREHR